MALHANQACIDCHTDDAALQGVHEGLTIASIAETDALSKTVVAESTCTESNCHARDEIFVQATVNSSALTDVKKNVVNPHALPIFEDRGRGSHASITCGNCHQMHSTENIEETAQDVCKNCHHKGTYETCYTALCHAE
ncbi:MAG: hypothetical protein LBI64_02830 [Coriobacteriales bacterium]|jgi:hypothetical protein|nr:hypothetical protein [Coriobacteriales bacterium]